MTVLVTGGAGYIGGHVVDQLLATGERVVVVDDMTTGVRERLGGLPRLDVDLATSDAPAALEAFMREHEVEAVVHFAAKKQVGESVARPAWYYAQNMTGLANVLLAMEAAGARTLVFSSSAAVYGQGTGEPAREDDPCSPINPYGETKLAGEWLVDAARRAGAVDAVSLRYFNVAGAASTRLADRFALNLVPMVFERLDRGEAPRVFGDDYPTADGSCVRDYVHVVDLAAAHLAALAALRRGAPVSPALNVATGRGYSVFEVLETIREVTGIPTPPVVEPRRPGDPAVLVADPARIREELSWTASLGLRDMVESAWAARTALREARV